MANAPTRFIKAGRNEGEAVDLLNNLFDVAARMGASDVHIEDEDADTVIRLRIGGDLQEFKRIDKQTALICDAKIRAVCQMSLSDRMGAMDGRMFIEVDSRMVDVRVSVLPSRTGQSVVCRLLDQQNAARRLAEIAMTPSVRTALGGVLAEPDGLVLMTGPTGSGKTSTLYAMLNELNKPEAKIVTVEDPVEYRLTRAVQVNVNERLTFANALRAILRQDPDIILVGEIRDQETAKIAVEASMTGHLVLSTLHANDAPTTLTRLVDLGVDPFTLGAVLRCVIAQRLSKRLCPHCCTSYELTRGEMDWLRFYDPDHSGTGFWHSPGCEHCANTGINGRIPVMEMAVGDAAVRLAITKNSRSEIARAAQRQGQYETLVQAGMRLALEGQISLAEVRKLASGMDGITDSPATTTTKNPTSVSGVHA